MSIWREAYIVGIGSDGVTDPKIAILSGTEAISRATPLRRPTEPLELCAYSKSATAAKLAATVAEPAHVPLMKPRMAGPA